MEENRQALVTLVFEPGNQCLEGAFRVRWPEGLRLFGLTVQGLGFQPGLQSSGLVAGYVQGL